MPNVAIDDYHELLALHRLILAAKFGEAALEGPLHGSSLIAAIAERVLAALIEADCTRDGPVAAERWRVWRQLDPSRREWKVAVQRASECARWDDWSEAERVGYSELVLAPFILPDELRDSFLAQVTTSRRPPRA